MPNTRIRDKWETLVKTTSADHPRWGPSRILQRLKEVAKKEGLGDDYPSQRTIGRIKDGMTPEDLKTYASFRWPESLEERALPWEASGAGLELLMLLDTNGIRERPPVRLVKWYWRVREACPDATLALSFDIAYGLMLRDDRKEPMDRGTEWLLAYHQILKGRSPLQVNPLVKPKDAGTHEEFVGLYRKALDRQDGPIPRAEFGDPAWSVASGNPDFKFLVKRTRRVVYGTVSRLTGGIFPSIQPGLARLRESMIDVD